MPCWMSCRPSSLAPRASSHRAVARAAFRPPRCPSPTSAPVSADISPLSTCFCRHFAPAHLFPQTLREKPPLAPLFTDLSAQSDVSGNRFAQFPRSWKPQWPRAASSGSIRCLVSSNDDASRFGFHKRKWGKGRWRGMGWSRGGKVFGQGGDVTSGRNLDCSHEDSGGDERGR
jgi:hypothetical protein